MVFKASPRLLPHFEVINEDHNDVRLNLTMNSFLQEHSPGVENQEYEFLYKMLNQHNILKHIHHLEEAQDSRDDHCNKLLQNAVKVFTILDQRKVIKRILYFSTFFFTTTTYTISNSWIFIRSGPDQARELWRNL